MIAVAHWRTKGMLVILVLITYCDFALAQSPTTWNESVELQKAINNTLHPTPKNLAEEDIPSLRIPPATESGVSSKTEPSWLFVDYAKIDEYEEKISTMSKDQQHDLKKILGLMRIGKVPSQSVSWVQGTNNPPEFTLHDWDLANAEFSNGMILIENGRRRVAGGEFLEGNASIYFIGFHFGGLNMNNTSCLTDMTKAVISKPTTNASVRKGSRETTLNHKQKWPFRYGGFFIFDDDFEKSDILYYKGSQRIVIDKKAANKRRERKQRDPAAMFYNFPGLIEFKGELCGNLAFARDFRE